VADRDLSQLTDDEKTALAALLKRTIDGDRYPLSPRIGVLRGILDLLEPRPAKPAASLEPRVYAPQRASAAIREGRAR
jgi:hypothetical protein